MTRILKTLALPVTVSFDAVRKMSKKDKLITAIIAAILITAIVIVSLLKGEKMDHMRSQMRHWLHEHRAAIGVCVGLIYLAAVGILYFRNEHKRVNEQNKIHDASDVVNEAVTKERERGYEHTKEMLQQYADLNAKAKKAEQELAQTRAEMEALKRDAWQVFEDPTRMVVARGWTIDPVSRAKYCTLYIYKKNEDGSRGSLETTIPIWRTKR